MTQLNASDTRIPPAAFNGVAFKGDRVCILRRDGERIYLVSAEDMRLLEALEDRRDAVEALDALARHEATDDSTVGLEDLKRRLGL